MQLTELKLISKNEFNAWNATWDGQSKPPDYILHYFVKVVLPASAARQQAIIDEMYKAINENQRTI